MKKSDLKASIDSIETFGLVDGPGIRTVIFFNGCQLRCRYCHNPEMWNKKEETIGVEELVQKILRNKPYYRKNGGVTFSGGEPLLHHDYLLEVCKRLKEENIHICLDTAGVGLGFYEDLLKYIDLILLDVKHTENTLYQEITGTKLEEVERFISACNQCKKKVWIRQVIIPNVNDTYEYMDSLHEYLKHIDGIERIDFLPFHRMGREKYLKLNIPYPYEEKKDMDPKKTEELYAYLIKKRNDI